MNVDSTTYIKTAITETTAYKMETSIFEDKVPVVFTQAGNTISSTCGSGIRHLLPSSGPFAWTFCAGAQGGLGSASGSGIGDALGEGCCEVNTGASGGQWTCGPLYAAMNRLQDDYDPYALEEPSDEDPALSRWAAVPPWPLAPTSLGLRPALRSLSLTVLRSLRTAGPAAPAAVAPHCRLWEGTGVGEDREGAFGMGSWAPAEAGLPQARVPGKRPSGIAGAQCKPSKP
jgi:hypothetical protein